MILTTSNKSHRLLFFSYVQRVSAEDIRRSREEAKLLLPELPPDMRLLADLSQLESMDPDCLSELGRNMDLLGQHGVGLIVRVIPDAAKDIGLNILTIFHYPHHIRTVTCQTMAQALHQLSLQ